MSVLSHQSIKMSNIFDPFCNRAVHEPTDLTYGCGAASYDVRLAKDVYLRKDVVTLASTLERFSMPENVCGVVHDKSSLARAGILVQNTFIDPGWRGYLTLEISYHWVYPWKDYERKGVQLKEGTPIAQIVLHRLDAHTLKPYDGQYQDQANKAVPSKLKL